MSVEAIALQQPNYQADRVIEASRVLDGYVERTPLIEFDDLAGGVRLLGKYEAAQRGGSFKARGAYVKMHELHAGGVRRVVCASAGNHGIGVAEAARALGVEATVFLPTTLPEERMRRVVAHGRDADGKEWAYVRRIGQTVDEALTAARQTGQEMIEPFDDPSVIAGQGSLIHEIIDQTDNSVDRLFVPVGGGGIAAGALQAVADNRRVSEVVLVQLEGNDSAEKSFWAGEVVAASALNRLAVGSAVDKIGQHCLGVIRAQRRRVRFVTVSASDIGYCLSREEQLRQQWAPAMGDAAFEAFPEVTGVMAEAGARKYAQQLVTEQRPATGETWVAVVSGANVDRVAEDQAVSAYHATARRLGETAASSLVGYSGIR